MTKDYTASGYWTSILNASLCKFFILRALCEGPAHGYEIIRRVDTMTNGFCVPNEGTVYPVLREFEQCGCATCHQETVSGRVRKVYSVTRKGQEAYMAGRDIWQKGLCCVGQVIEDPEIPTGHLSDC